MSRNSQKIQIHDTPQQKTVPQHLARGTGPKGSGDVAQPTLEARARFGELVAALRDHGDHRFALAELNDLLSSLAAPQLADAVAVAPGELRELSPLLQNYVAAMVEQASHQRAVPPPAWVREVPPLAVPYFAAPLRSLRLHLLRAAPVPFKRRNLFVDSGVGARV